MVTNRFVSATAASYIAKLPQEKQHEVAQQVVDEQLSCCDTAELVKQIKEPEIHARSNHREFQDSSLFHRFR